MQNIVTKSNMSEWVKYAFNKCIIQEGEDTSVQTKVNGLNKMYGFNPKRLKQCRLLITEIVSNLSESFSTEHGDSFLDVWKYKDDDYWTKDIKVCEQLVVLAIGLGLMEYTFEPGMWKFLPNNGTPIIRVCHK